MNDLMIILERSISSQEGPSFDAETSLNSIKARLITTHDLVSIYKILV